MSEPADERSPCAESASVQTAFERRCTVHLNGDKHETLMTERSGLFSIYCGCGWKAQDLRFADAETAERAHSRGVQA